MSSTIQVLIKEALKKYSKKEAVQRKDLIITYEELEERINSLSNYLIELNIPENTYIGVSFDDVIDYIISIIAILNIRCVFVPVDKNLPVERVKYIVNNCNIKYVICNDCFYNENGYVVNSINYTWKDQLNYNQNIKKNICRDYSVEDAIYIFFTSGTTGNPKGVIGKNESLVHFLNWEINEFSLKEGYRYTQLTSPSFDPFLREIFCPLLSGGTICLFETADKIKNILFLPLWIEHYKINIIHCVPSVFRIFASVLYSKKLKSEYLKYIFLAGEEPVPKDLRLWIKAECNRNTKLINFYGPTETTLVKMYHEISEYDIKRGVIPIGKPIPEVNVYLYDTHGKETDFGEICIDTKYCSLGYINPEENLNKFLKSPYDRERTLYKTGDIGKKTDNGEIVFCGRLDRQIKISGISVNLDSLEKTITNNIKEIKACCVVLNNEKIVCFYETVVDIDVSELIKCLKKFFHKSVLPKNFIKVDKIKLNFNGKINRDYYSKYK